MFNRPEPKVVFGDVIRGLLSDAPKKNAWGLADHLGYASPISFQHLMYGARWDADVLRDQARSYVVDAVRPWWFIQAARSIARRLMWLVLVRSSACPFR